MNTLLGFFMSLALGAVLIAQGAGAGQAGPPQGAPGRGQRPMRAQPQRVDAPRGTSIIRGQIVAADSGSPIRRAQVRVASPDAREGRVATTDQQGRFEFKELPAGRYTMTASKGGFVSLQYGQRRPSESGTPIELADGQTMEKVAIALPRGSVIGGRITDEFGEPVANASVSAWRYAYAGGARRMMPAGQNARDTTDDQGHFRLFGLPPGDYYVSATLRGGGPEVTDPMGELSGYAATYFPGTPNVAEATRITLAVAQENTGISFGLIATRLVRVAGQVLMSDGAPATNGMVVLVPANASGRPGLAMQQGGAGNRIDQTGAFRVTNVAPGRYQVQARAGGREFELARLDLSVGTEDLEGLTLVTAPGAMINGSIVSDTGEPFDFRPNQLQVGARPSSPDTQAMAPGMASVRVGEDWSFTLRNISEAVTIRAQPPQAWTMKAVFVNGQDITDTPTEFPAGQTVSGIQIVLTKKVTSLTGQVSDAKGNPVLDATVVVFPSNEKLWTFQSRFIKAARPDQDGKYRVTALPGSENYLVVALQGLEDGQAGDPEFLATVKELATKLELGEGESKAVDVKLSVQKTQ
ncbi:MAG TPA: carboxypeptidase-like regulatory domain-containing protein [Vicinamibacterales bacterium]|nr:carboxypeptidase-like regulatory domain-containing protein [Vicinamibacterales bacterium]